MLNYQGIQLVLLHAVRYTITFKNLQIYHSTETRPLWTKNVTAINPTTLSPCS